MENNGRNEIKLSLKRIETQTEGGRKSENGAQKMNEL